MALKLDRVDHIHVYVPDRPAAEKWYRDVLGFQRNAKLEEWAVPHGPLMLCNESGSVMLSVFERPIEPNRAVIAFGVSGNEFMEWLEHLGNVLDEAPQPVDHGVSWSIYFYDLDRNPFEITTYDYEVVKNRKTW